MLHSMRKYQKYIIYATAFLFIVGMAIGGITGIFSGQPKVGKVGGKNIMLQDFNIALQARIRQYTDESNVQEISPVKLAELNNEVWEQTVNQIIFAREIKRRHLKATDDDVIEHLKSQPDEAVKDFEPFQTNGQFDMQKYLDAITSGEMPSVTLNNGQQINLFDWMEQRARDQIPYEKLYKDVIDEQGVTDDEVHQYYQEKTESAEARVIFFDPKKIEEIEITDADLQAYYDAHKEDYKRPIARKLGYVKFELKASDADIEAAHKTALDILARIRNGEKFADLAREFSQAPGSAENGGEMDYFGKGRMVPEFENAAFALRNGQISEPVKTSYGWHIIEKMGERTGADGQKEVKVRHILIKTDPSDDTRYALSKQADELYELAQTKGLEVAARELNYLYVVSQEITADAKYIGGIGQAEDLVNFAYSAELGKLNDPWEDQRGNQFIVALAQILPEHYQSLDDVRQRITSKVQMAKKVAAVQALADKFMAGHTPDQYFTAAEAEGWEVVDGTNITLKHAQMARVGNQEELNQAILETPVGQFTPLVTTERGVYLASPTKHTDPDWDAYKDQVEDLRTEIRQNNANDYWTEWLDSMHKKYRVKDMRAQYYPYLEEAAAETPEK